MVHKYSHSKIPVSIIGARGYSGLELARILLFHAAVELKTAFATRDFSLQEELMLDQASTVKCLTDDQMMHNLGELVFLATPSAVSLELAAQILKQGKTVIDLSGAFRLDSAGAEYGLAPFCGPSPAATPSRGVQPKLISNPGCYATAVQLALIPLLKHDLIEADSIAIDAKSGTTGRGPTGCGKSIIRRGGGGVSALPGRRPPAFARNKKVCAEIFGSGD